MKHFVTVISLSFALLFSIGCSSDETTIPEAKGSNYTILKGRVLDTAGSPLSGAQVTSGTKETTTANDGSFSFSFEQDQVASVTVDLPNYTQNSRSIPLIKTETVLANMVLAPIDSLTRFNADDAQLIKTKGASVDLPANGFVDQNGAIFSGEVTAKVSYNRVTTPLGEALFPGDFIGLEDNGSTTGIISYGFIEVTLEDASGNPLNLAEGETATITYPADPNIDTHPATIPLWYYDTTRGIWVEDGVATYDVATDSYSGTVSHFTTWNLDAKFDGASFEGCVEDASGARITTADLYVSTNGWAKRKNNQDATGSFKFINAPSNNEMTFFAKNGEQVSSAFKLTLTPGESKVFTDCVVVDQDASALFAKVKGQLVMGDGTPISDQNMYIYDKNDRYLGSARSDENGSFLSNEFRRPQTPNLKLQINLNAINTIDKRVMISPVKYLSDLGKIQINVSHVSGCIQKSDGNTTFENGATVTLDTPYNNYRGNLWADNDGLFELYIEQDYKAHTLYSYIDNSYLYGAPARVASFEEDYTLLGKTEFTADSNTVDLTDACIVMNSPVAINKNVTVTMTSSRADAYLSVTYDTYADYEDPNTFGEEVFDGSDTTARTASFNVTKNGIYYIFQEVTNYNDEDYDGTFSITVDGVTQSITIPDNANAYDGWAGFALEVFQGEVKVIILNKEAGCQC